MTDGINTGLSAVPTAVKYGNSWTNGEKEKDRKSRDIWIMKWKGSMRS